MSTIATHDAQCVRSAATGEEAERIFEAECRFEAVTSALALIGLTATDIVDSMIKLGDAGLRFLQGTAE